MRSSPRHVDPAARSWAPVCLLAVGLVLGAQAQQPAALDLTDDLYHRIRAGLFRPEAEPVVLRVERTVSTGAVPVAGEYVHFAWDQARFAVRTTPRGTVVVHMDRELALSHVTVTVPLRFDLTREFDEYPVHPIR